MRRPRLTYANVVSTIALGLALTGGTAIAASTIGSEDIKNGAVRSVDLKNNDIKSVDIKNGQIRKADLARTTRLTAYGLAKRITLTPGEVKVFGVRCRGRDIPVSWGAGSAGGWIAASRAYLNASAVRFTLVHVGEAGTPPDTFEGQVNCLSGGALR